MKSRACEPCAGSGRLWGAVPWASCHACGGLGLTLVGRPTPALLTMNRAARDVARAKRSA